MVVDFSPFLLSSRNLRYCLLFWPSSKICVTKRVIVVWGPGFPIFQSCPPCETRVENYTRPRLSYGSHNQSQILSTSKHPTCKERLPSFLVTHREAFMILYGCCTREDIGEQAPGWISTSGRTVGFRHKMATNSGHHPQILMIVQECSNLLTIQVGDGMRHSLETISTRLKQNRFWLSHYLVETPVTISIGKVQRMAFKRLAQFITWKELMGEKTMEEAVAQLWRTMRYGPNSANQLSKLLLITLIFY